VTIVDVPFANSRLVHHFFNREALPRPTAIALSRAGKGAGTCKVNCSSIFCRVSHFASPSRHGVSGLRGRASGRLTLWQTSRAARSCLVTPSANRARSSSQLSTLWPESALLSRDPRRCTGSGELPAPTDDRRNILRLSSPRARSTHLRPGTPLALPPRAPSSRCERSSTEA